MKGLVCAGGEATRLGELTRITNKHLLPVGRWPLVYYPLQLLQLCGIREVLLVTAQQHAGDFIDLLGDGRVLARGSDEPLFDLDLSYKVQTEAGGIAQVVGMAEGFAAGGKLVVCLGDNIFEYAESRAIREFAGRDSGAQIFVKEVPDPDRFGVGAYGEAGETGANKPAARSRASSPSRAGASRTSAAGSSSSGASRACRSPRCRRTSRSRAPASSAACTTT